MNIFRILPKRLLELAELTVEFLQNNEQVSLWYTGSFTENGITRSAKGHYQDALMHIRTKGKGVGDYVEGAKETRRSSDKGKISVVLKLVVHQNGRCEYYF